jgi:hypothetical protein
MQRKQKAATRCGSPLSDAGESRILEKLAGWDEFVDFSQKSGGEVPFSP